MFITWSYTSYKLGCKEVSAFYNLALSLSFCSHRENPVALSWAPISTGGDHGVKAQGDGWVLTVALIEGANLASLGSTDLSDPYVVFTCNAKTRTSSVKLQTRDPQWNGASLICSWSNPLISSIQFCIDFINVEYFTQRYLSLMQRKNLHQFWMWKYMISMAHLIKLPHLGMPRSISWSTRLLNSPTCGSPLRGS